MNPLAPFVWLLDNWRTVIFVALLAALGWQTYALRGVTAERDLLALEKKERMQRDGMRDAQNLKNKERTDEDFAAARKRALAQRVQSKPTAGISTTEKIELAGSSGDGTICFGGEQLGIELAGFAQRHAARLTEILAGISQRNAERFSAIAQQGEELAAAYRACRAYTLNLAEENAPGKDGNEIGVGGTAIAPPLPELREATAALTDEAK